MITPATPPPATPPAATPPPAAPPAPEALPPKFMERMAKGTDSTNGIPPEPTPPPAPPAPAAAPALAAAAPPAPEAPPAPAPKKERKVAKGYREPAAPAPGITKSDVKEIVDGAVRAATEAAKPAPLPEPELLEEEKEQIEVFTQMEKMFPDKYKGLVTKAKGAIAAFTKFEDDWKKAHPGEEFDSESKEAEEFVKKNSPEYRMADFDKAKIHREMAPVVAENETLKKELAKVTAETSEAKLAPIITATVAESARTVATELNPKLADVVKVDGTVDPVKAAAFIEENPEVGHILVDGIAQAQEWSNAVALMAADKADKVPAPMFKRVNEFCFELEGRIKALEPEKQLDAKGRTFATKAELNGMTEVQRQKHWTLTPDFIIYRANKDVIRGATGAAKAEQERIDKIAAKRGVPKPAAPAPAATAPAPEPSRSKKPDTIESTAGGAGDPPTPGSPTEGSFAKRMKGGTGIMTV